MSTTFVDIPSTPAPPSLPRDGQRPLTWQLDRERGSWGIGLFILTEAFLFVMFFTAYFYLAKGGWRWLDEKPPALHYVIPMLIILLASSGVVYWGEERVKEGGYQKGRIALTGTILLGLVFLVLSAFDYKEHMKDVIPQSDAYGSIFYTIVTFHVAHLCLGLLMLLFTLFLPKYEPRRWPPYRPYHNAAMYWHFVDFVWVFIVFFLYVAPNIR